MAFRETMEAFFHSFSFPDEYWNIGEVELRHSFYCLYFIYFRSMVWITYNAVENTGVYNFEINS